MRIISGKNKGRHIVPPKDFSARPTTDIAKESLFNILTNNYDLEEISALDLFSGTGGISYEFISRGAKNVTSVEVKDKHAHFIRETAHKLSMNIKVVQQNAFLFIKKTKQKFDIIFCDPPYQLDGILLIPDLVFEHNLLLPGGCLIVEHSSKQDFSTFNYFTECREYGKVHFSFFIFPK